ncbi:MAG: hypothetical protein ABR582_17650, partial [Gemmatimonadaceae bacterium]
VYTPPAETPDTSKPVAAEGSASHYVDGGDSMRFIAHDENLPVGFPAGAKPLTLVNPFEGKKQAIATGAQLFITYNCMDCHG